MHRPLSCGRGCRAFTLVELLVVISIIALLIAILIPSLSKARDQTKGVICLTRLRSLSHGWHMYADDNNDVCVPGRYGNQSGGTANPANWYDVGNGLKYRPRWVATMGKYVGIFAFDKPRTDTDRQNYDSEVYQCPKVPEWINERNYAFGYNHQFLGNPRQTAGQYHNFPVVRSRVRSMAGTVLGADCMGTAGGVPRLSRKPFDPAGSDFASLGNHGWTLDPPRLTDKSDRGTGDPGTPTATVDPRHGDRVNVIYCDGHGETAQPYALGYRIQSDGQFVDQGQNPITEDPPHNQHFSGTGADDDPPDLPT